MADLPLFKLLHSFLHRACVMKVLEAHHLQKTYRQGSKEVRAVVDVSLTIAAGEILAFLGPNGAGKTTTIALRAARGEQAHCRADL